LQTKRTSGAPTRNDDPSQVQQRVFHLDEIEDRKEAVQDKIVGHMLS